MLKRTIASVTLVAATSFAATATWINQDVPETGMTRGALIIDGSEIPPPFRFERNNDQLLVNDRLILECPVELIPEPLDMETRHGVIQNALDQYLIINQNNSREFAVQDTLAMIRGSKLVENAQAMQDDLIEIQFKGQAYPDMLELSGERMKPLTPQARQQILINHRRMIENFLRADSLVILIDGIVLATEPGTAEERLNLIREAAEAELDFNAMKDQYQLATGDSLVAELLTQRVVQAAAKAVQP